MKMIKSIQEGVLVLGMAIAFFSCDLASQPTNTSQFDGEEDIYADVEFEMPKVNLPVFAENECVITDYGAVNDGITNNAEAFANAIEAISKRGGGRVIVPRGIWLTGPIELRSNINLHVAEGALIIFSKNFDEYPIIRTSFEGLETYRCKAPIYGKDLENVAITGRGIIDGSGDAWRPVKKEKLTERHWRTLVRSGGVVSNDGKIWYPTEKSKKETVGIILMCLILMIQSNSKT